MDDRLHGVLVDEGQVSRPQLRQAAEGPDRGGRGPQRVVGAEEQLADGAPLLGTHQGEEGVHGPGRHARDIGVHVGVLAQHDVGIALPRVSHVRHDLLQVGMTTRHLIDDQRLAHGKTADGARRGAHVPQQYQAVCGRDPVEVVEGRVDRIEEGQHRVQLDAAEAEGDRLVELVAPVPVQGVDRGERHGGRPDLLDEVGDVAVGGAHPRLGRGQPERDGHVDARGRHHLVEALGRDQGVRLAAVGAFPVVAVLVPPVIGAVAVTVHVDDH